MIFLLQQFGLIELRPARFSEQEQKDWNMNGWLAGKARLTPWGMAVAWALLEFWKRELGDEEIEDDELSFDTESSDEGDDEIRFGTLQPVFQPYFPDWGTVYTLPAREVRLGAHTFKVTLAGWRGGGGSIWRRLLVPPDASLDDLADAILCAFKLDDDHLYDFRYRDQRGKSRVYYRPCTNEGPFTSEVAVGETGLAIKNVMRFTFDYGDNWQFDVRLEAVDTDSCRLGKPKVIESAGKAPEQYPHSDF